MAVVELLEINGELLMPIPASEIEAAGWTGNETVNVYVRSGQMVVDRIRPDTQAGDMLTRPVDRWPTDRHSRRS